MITLLEHPWLLTLLIVACLMALGMTYEFILRLFGKKSILEDDEDKENDEPFELPHNKGDTDKYIYSEKKGNY